LWAPWREVIMTVTFRATVFTETGTINITPTIIIVVEMDRSDSFEQEYSHTTIESTNASTRLHGE